MPTSNLHYCIIGAGISGLSAAYFLRQKYPDAKITIIEKSSQPGGLGSWVEINGYSIEPYYHHFFESDSYIKRLSAELAISDKLYFKKAKSAYFYDDGVIKLAGPLDLLFFKKLSLIERARVIASMVYLKLLPNGTQLDKFTVKEWMHKWIGENAYSILWEPLMVGKFEQYADQISMSWMWGRIHDRTIKLGYFRGGVRVFFSALEKWLLNNNVDILYNTSVNSVSKSTEKFDVICDTSSLQCDKLIFTTISPVFAKIAKNLLPNSYISQLEQIKHIGTVCLLLELKEEIQTNYWLNMCSKKTPYLISIEHTNFVNKQEYNQNTILYLAKYSDPNSEFFNKPDNYYADEAAIALKLLKSDFNKDNITNIKLAKVRSSQTLFLKGYSNLKPEIVTPDKDIYLINIDQTFPHDRNLNMGIYLADKLCKII